MAKRKGPRIENAELLQAVCDEPDSDEPRLVYADWLEEQGETERAEHIRLQIQMSQPRLKPGKWLKLAERRDALEAKYRESWVEQFPPLKGILWHTDFERGFPQSITAANYTAFRAHADKIFRTAPITSLGFMRLGGTKRLAQLPHLSRLTTLILADLRLGPEDAEALANSPYVSGLDHLHLSGNRLGDEGAGALARSPYLKNLAILDLGYNDIGSEGVKALAQSTHLPALTGLGLSGNEFDDDGARALMKTVLFKKKFTGLTLWDIYGLSDQVCKQLKKRFGDYVSFED
jgi:uncharacterized protein (TIGR02996 family)